MEKKKDRLDTIKEIIATKKIGSQEELLQELIQEGFDLTQATLSRDLKKLNVAKVAINKRKHVYVLPNTMVYHHGEDWHLSKSSGAFKSIHFSGNIAVIKTRPGYASGIASDIDSREPEDVLGTIAGDDTIMLVLREGAKQEKVRSFLSFIIPH